MGENKLRHREEKEGGSGEEGKVGENKSRWGRVAAEGKKRRVKVGCGFEGRVLKGFFPRSPSPFPPPLLVSHTPTCVRGEDGGWRMGEGKEEISL